MIHADAVLADEYVVAAVYEALAKRHPNTRSQGKLLSLFEPSTEVIRKGDAGKPNEFGKMVKLQEAENRIKPCWDACRVR
jgi:hypothetical protein